ncbi:MAG: putative metal-binding motif-containing protein, partial [Armatimonadetes bacterium]|nr:putative metal-binding motif-containing protein [Armatimonadota bacterium]
MRSIHLNALLVLLLFLLGCPTDDTGDDDTASVDADQDGFNEVVDCDDTDPQTYPGAAELCDGVDNDCDGAVQGDEVDADGDTYLACADCDDGDALTFPGAAEL